jgi:hypothetical protein
MYAALNSDPSDPDVIIGCFELKKKRVGQYACRSIMNDRAKVFPGRVAGGNGISPFCIGGTVFSCCCTTSLIVSLLKCQNLSSKPQVVTALRDVPRFTHAGQR